MKRPLAFLTLLLAATPCFAHFVYIAPSVEKGEFQVVFSEDPSPDEKVDINKIIATKLVSIDVSGKLSSIEWSKTEHALRGALPEPKPLVLAGVTDYGWVQSKHTGNVPVLLKYYSKAIVGDIRGLPEQPLGKEIPFEIVPKVENGSLALVALQNGKPLANATCAVLAPGDEKAPMEKTDAEGRINGKFERPGRYSVKVKAIEEKAGEWKGQKYDKEHLWATLVFDVKPSNP